MKAGYLIGYVIIVLAYILERSLKPFKYLLIGFLLTSCATQTEIIQQEHTVHISDRGTDFEPTGKPQKVEFKDGDKVMFIRRGKKERKRQMEAGYIVYVRAY
jgi:hypothetical protein